MRARWLTVLAALAAAPAIAVDPRPTLPPFADAYEPHGVDERGVWIEADEHERSLRDSAFVIHDAALNAYVRQVLCRTVGADRCRGARVYVLRVAAFNASMMPNGAMRVWSGLLLRVRNEAELAGVLGHEFAHFERRHTLAGYRHQRGATDVAVWAGLLLGANGAAVRQSAIGSIYAFQRDQEREADLLSAQYMAAAGYDQRSFAAIWTRAMDEADATALGRRQRSTRYDRVAFFASHPTNLERATYLRDVAAKSPAGGETGQAAFDAVMTPRRADFLADQVKLNDFGGTDYLLQQLAASGWSEDLLFARGELYRTRGNPRDLVTAADCYRQAVALQPGHAEAWRGLGMAALRGGDPVAGRAALRQYLTLRPAAPDAAMVATLVAE